MRFLLILIFVLTAQLSFSQEHAWVYFTDKPNVSAALANPISILSQDAIDRKNLHNIPIDARDVPVNENYISTIKSQTGITVKAKSKWFNCVHVIGTAIDISALETLAFVDEIKYADETLNDRPSGVQQNKSTDKFQEQLVDFDYGQTANQIEMLGVDYLHENDFTGEGMTIAVMDTGFPLVNNIGAFNRIINNNDLLGGYDFVLRSPNYEFSSDHGTKVLSTMAGYIEDDYVGSAPDASYYLFRTEDTSSETPVEESYWVEAAERADSLGVDIINTSLGYNNYDNPNHSYTPADMDGNTAFISKGANIAVEKGILVVVSAGNSATNSDFPIVNAPADSNAYTVGAVGSNGNYVYFSSIGPTADNRVKPDGMALGFFASIINTNGGTSAANGTSFAAPILAGAIACFWQANPNLTNVEIMQKVRESSSLYNNPNDMMGYGIPNFEIALNDLLDMPKHQLEQLTYYPNPVENILHIESHQQQFSKIQIFDILGKSVLTINKNFNKIDVSHLPSGMYLVQIETETEIRNFKIIKQ